ncbi:MAG: hypothetical protein GC155_17890 [Alphaproteobacteria bacterium]|nr:hypothetical protein [Alphaproteobacteria bacterium]
MNLPKRLAAVVILVGALAAPALAQQKHAPPTPEQRAARFDKADANKDGVLTKAEFTAAIAADRQARIDRMWAHLDPTGKDSITKADYLAAPMGHGHRHAGHGKSADTTATQN